MTGRILIVLVLALVAGACAGEVAPTTSVPSAVPTDPVVAAIDESSPTTTPPASGNGTINREPPRFQPASCFTRELRDLIEWGTYEIECGYVVVPENREIFDGPTVSLPVVVARTDNPNPQPDPVIYLAGGGGHAHLDYAHYYLDSVGDAILEDRDFIQYNQRGAPDTDPELDCPGYTDFLFSLASHSELGSLWTEEHIDYLDECRQALLDRGVDLTQYNSAANAADARSVRIALGYEEANYYGTSYGTRLGLDLIRDHPDGVRSIILDSVYPPEADYYGEYALTAQRAFDAVFAACAADSECVARYPALETDFYAAADRLDTQPETVDSPFGSVAVDGGVFMDAMLIYLYSPEWVLKAPQAMARVAAGDLAPVEDVVVGAITAPDINWNMFYAMQCREEVPFSSLEQARLLSADLPDQIVAHYTESFARFHFEMCETAKSGVADPIESRAVTSSVPALILSGEFDPATPPAWSEGAAAPLGNATYFDFPTMGHGILRSSECGMQIGLDFIADPSVPPDGSCIARMSPIAFEIGE